ncbi:hypothetical protein LCGC14_0371590 [marine sediment metagenome]|uniref:Uncharacterized protein n=1 Tax=marine sediment metagenome TaxID=412755 RepID=A0A0F9TN08_9ZZZZ
MSDLEAIFKKLSNGIKTVYINDLKTMKDFNSASSSEEKNEVIEQFFDEITRMLLELKLAHAESAFWYEIVSTNLNFYIKRTVEILKISRESAMKLREEIL